MKKVIFIHAILFVSGLFMFTVKAKSEKDAPKNQRRRYTIAMLLALRPATTQLAISCKHPTKKAGKIS